MEEDISTRKKDHGLGGSAKERYEEKRMDGVVGLPKITAAQQAAVTVGFFAALFLLGLHFPVAATWMRAVEAGIGVGLLGGMFGLFAGWRKGPTVIYGLITCGFLYEVILFFMQEIEVRGWIILVVIYPVIRKVSRAQENWEEMDYARELRELRQGPGVKGGDES